MSSDQPEDRLDDSEIVDADLAGNQQAIHTDPATDPFANVAAEELSFLHPTSLIFDLIAHGKTYLVPAAFGLWGAAKGDMTLLIISAIIFIPAVLASVFRYFTFRYCIKDDQLIVRQGLIFRNVRTVPISRIQNIDFVQNPLHRILNVAEVKVETASGTKPEATLRVLSMAQMESLRGSVFDSKSDSRLLPVIANPSANDGAEIEGPLAFTNETPAGATLRTEPATTLLEIPLTLLIKAGLASNRGMIMVGVAMGLYYQFAGRDNFISFDWLRNLWAANTSWTVIIATAAVGLFVAFLLLRILGVGWYILRFFGYKLVRRGDDLRISCGLLTKVSATVPRQRVQFISVHRNMIMRIMGLASIRIETAGGAGTDGENATESVSKRWFVPVIPEDKIPELIQILRPGLEWDEAGLDFKPLADKAARRLSRLAIVQSIIVAIIGLGITRPWGWGFGVAILPFLVMWAVKKSKAMRYARTADGVVYRSGVFNRKTSMTFFEKIQTLRVDQSPFDRRWGMAKLSVDTAAAGPAEHSIQVPYLDERFATEELQTLREKTAEEQPVFG